MAKTQVNTTGVKTKPKAKKLSAKELRLRAYNAVITKNKKLFKQGQTLSRADFVALFGIQGIVHSGSYKKVHRSNLKLVAAQGEINMLMRQNGLYLKARDYYGRFVVQDKTRTKAEVERYSAEVEVNKGCTDRLIDNLELRNNAGTWGTYNKVSNADISTICTPPKPTKRQTNVTNRLTLI